ncbi:MAG: adenine phosphoribosyltransferase [Chitinophagales bacterium]|nr:adenine phosphoribosyltransferase [Chitinophagales bacterium]MDW8273846.1 adenine phosphoribosyltransferase [Chitinophagales bacterium]
MEKLQKLKEDIKKVIRDIPDFPQKGILFRDIAPLFLHPDLCKQTLEALAELATQNNSIDAVAGIESRGFLFGILLAHHLQVPFFLIRKKGKLPGPTSIVEYKLEYGTAAIEMQKGYLKPGSRVLVHDDVLATGGTAEAAAKLVLQEQGFVACFAFLIELSVLNGRNKLKEIQAPIVSLLNY